MDATTDETTDDTIDRPAMPLAVIVYDGDFDVGPLLDAVRARLEAHGGLRLGGIVPKFGDLLPNGRHQMLLENVATGEKALISQNLGAGAESCILDSDGFTRSRSAITAAIEAGVDLLFAGKFGKQEIAGHGVREEIGQAMIAGIPTLMAMRDRARPAWEDFAGTEWVALAPNLEDIVGWALAVTDRAERA